MPPGLPFAANPTSPSARTPVWTDGVKVVLAMVTREHGVGNSVFPSTVLA